MGVNHGSVSRPSYFEPISAQMNQRRLQQIGAERSQQHNLLVGDIEAAMTGPKDSAGLGRVGSSSVTRHLYGMEESHGQQSLSGSFKDDSHGVLKEHVGDASNQMAKDNSGGHISR